MNSTTGLRLGQLPQLVKASVRHLSVSAPLSRQGIYGVYQGPSPKGQGYEMWEGHGENIWVFTHRKTDQILYSFKEHMKGSRHIDQIPITTKKLKPAKLRKDYWHPLAKIEFAPGQGAIGRSVFQKLRELKHLHEVAWSDEIRYKRPDEYNEKEKEQAQRASEKGREFKVLRTKVQRGRAINAMKPYSIADMAAVLAGQGAGNKMLMGKKQTLADVTVRWANDEDKKNAAEWSSNVTHGLFDTPMYVSGNAENVSQAEAPAEQKSEQ